MTRILHIGDPPFCGGKQKRFMRAPNEMPNCQECLRIYNEALVDAELDKFRSEEDRLP